MQELQFKQAQMQSQMQMNDKKLTSEMAARADEIELKKSQIEGDLQLRGMQASAKIKADGDRQQFEQERTGVQIGVDIAKNKAQERMTARQAALAASKPTPTKEKPAT
jgi:outer membrane autotransporter protein